MKIKTILFKDLLSKAVKCASCNKMLPLTSLVEIKCENNEISLVTTDGNNFYKVSNECDGDLYAVVDITLLNNLISKTTSAEVELTKESTFLSVVGNGKYKITLPVNEAGTEIIFPNAFVPFEVVEEFTLEEETYKRIIKTNRAALLTTDSSSCYSGYYIGDCVITTDAYKICFNDNNISKTPILVNSNFMNLLDLCYGKVAVKVGKNNILVVSCNSTIVGTLMNNIDGFKASTIKDLVNNPNEYEVSINRASLLNALDRISLFVGPFDKNNINLHFTNETLEISSLKTTGVETLKYAFITEVNNFDCSIDANTLKQQITAQLGENVELHFGNSNFIKMIDGDTTQVVALSVE